MTWGNDLWNQTDNISTHTYNGIEFVERFSNFVKDKALIESEYSKQLKYSNVKAFNDTLFEIHQIAVQHEFVGQYYRENVLPSLIYLIQSLKEERKAHLTDISKLHQNLKISVDNMTKAKKIYIDAFKSSEEAQSRLQKSELDLNSPPTVTDRKRSEAITKLNLCEDAKTNYASQLCKTNELQVHHYTIMLPSVFDKLESMDKKRIEEFKRCMTSCNETERSTASGVSKSLINIEKYCQAINSDNDAQMVVDRYKCEPNQPMDYMFVDMSNTVTQSNRTSRADLTSMNPNEYSKKLQEAINEIRKQIKIKTDEREGAIRMRNVYSTNPALGNAKKIQSEIDLLNEEINKMETDLTQYEASLQANLNQPNGRMSIGTLSRTSEYKNQEKPRNNDNSFFSTLRRSPMGTPESSKSPKSKASFTLPFKKHSVTKTYNVNNPSPDDSFDLEFDTEPAKILGSCKAVYDFAGSNEDTITMKEGEQFYVLEHDSGDGWTKVRSKLDSKEGFVPTTYLNCSVSL